MKRRREYYQGQLAYAAGHTDTRCPYAWGVSQTLNQQRYWWMMGYYAAKYHT